MPVIVLGVVDAGLFASIPNIGYEVVVVVRVYVEVLGCLKTRSIGAGGGRDPTHIYNSDLSDRKLDVVGQGHMRNDVSRCASCDWDC